MFSFIIYPLLALSSVVISPPAPSGVSYEGYQVLRVEIQNQKQLDLLKSIIPQASFWNDLSIGDVDVIVSPSGNLQFKREIASLKSSVMIADVQDIVDAEREHSSLPLTEDQIFLDYQDASVYIAYLLKFPGTSKVSIGKSYLGNDIIGVKFGAGSKHVVAHGGIHAREWISPATTTFVASQLLGNSSDAIALQAAFTFTYIPVLNVDGYAYTRAKNGDRFWRKNRQPNNGSSCIGTDPNRNFPSGWSKPGASGSPCDESYYGPTANSAPESAAIYNYVKSLGDNVISYMDFHSYSQLWMFPYGNSCSSKAKDYDTLMAASAAATSALKATNGLAFKYGPSGSSVDSMYDQGVKYAFTAELRDTGRFGFALPAKYIIASGQEISNAMFALYNFIANQEKLRR